jgi:hypothetical protein
MSLIIQIYEKENLHERIAENVGWLCYCPTPWESMGADVQQRRVSFKLSNRISLFGTNVTCIQQKTVKRSGHGVIVDEIWTLHDVPFGDNFQVYTLFTFPFSLTTMSGKLLLGFRGFPPYFCICLVLYVHFSVKGIPNQTV